MLYFDRIDVSEGIAVNNTRASKECYICCYWYFLTKRFKFQPDVCNGWFFNNVYKLYQYF